MQTNEWKKNWRKKTWRKFSVVKWWACQAQVSFCWIGWTNGRYRARAHLITIASFLKCKRFKCKCWMKSFSKWLFRSHTPKWKSIEKKSEDRPVIYFVDVNAIYTRLFIFDDSIRSIQMQLDLITPEPETWFVWSKFHI